VRSSCGVRARTNCSKLSATPDHPIVFCRFYPLRRPQRTWRLEATPDSHPAPRPDTNFMPVPHAVGGHVMTDMTIRPKNIRHSARPASSRM